MKNVKEIAELIYSGLKNRDIEATISLISKEFEEEKTDKLQFTRTSLLNSIGRELGKMLLKEKWKFEGLMELWRKGGRDEKIIVINALNRICGREYENTKQFVSNVLNDISNWEICDQLALKVIANLAVENREEMFSLMEEWIVSENKWIRRLAIATIPPYIRARKKDSKICLDLLDKAMHEKDRDVKKAIGWALREVTKKDEIAVFKFLEKWAKVKDRNIRGIVRNGMKKMSEERQRKLKSLMSEINGK